MERVITQRQPDAFMHLVDRSIDGPADFIQTNIVGTSILLEVTRNYWNELDDNKKMNFRFHHVSTDEVYGDLEGTGFFTEETSYDSSLPYSGSKASSDHLVRRAWHRTYGLPIVITNYSHNYGSHQFPEKLIPLVILNALEGKPLPIYGTGEQIRDWLFVDDHARVLCLVLETGKDGETYNIGAHNEKANITVVKTICSLLDATLKPLEQLITYDVDRAGHDEGYAIGADKIDNELDWLPVEKGMQKTIQWYLDNKEGKK